MTSSRFHADHAGIARLLRSRQVGEALLRRAEKVKSRAEELAPVDENSDHPGRYRDSFETELGINRGRAQAIVRNTSREAIFVEKGTIYQEGQHVLARALSILRGH